MKKREKLPIDLRSFYNIEDGLVVGAKSSTTLDPKLLSASDDSLATKVVIEMQPVAGNLSKSEIQAFKKKYLKLNAKQCKLLEYASELLRYYNALILRIRSLDARMDMLVTEELVPVSVEISNSIAEKTLFANEESLTEFSQNLRKLVQFSLESLSKSYSNSNLEIIKKMSKIHDTCGAYSEAFTAIRDEILRYQPDNLPCLGNVVDYSRLSLQILSLFEAFLEKKINEVCINVSKFTLTILSLTQSDFSNSLDQLKESISSLEKRLLDEDFSKFKSRYVLFAAKYLSQGRAASSTTTKVVENSPHLSRFVNFFTPLSPHRFIDPEFDVVDQESEQNAKELLGLAAIDTLEDGNNCPLM